ncbi:hypothetical protein GECvBN5_gp170c [Salmonella phage GEC_vB_N5]|uniref:Uncharacterized protein n=1 Tax=Salmonella phage GEC_vB_N5 TaxID=2777378 RepID=A0A7S9SS30_9CAUD|nr:hypothetical protein GECvBN5_gp170c [Salmonella phage GEC_vB_N5]
MSLENSLKYLLSEMDIQLHRVKFFHIALLLCTLIALRYQR